MRPTDALRPLAGADGDYDPLLERAAAKRVVLLGEASHGTHEFYAERAAITKRLIAEHGFAAVAVEGDWPDAYRVNLHVRGASGDESPEEALADFRRFPAWMWRNAEVVEFVAWLREWNRRNRPSARLRGAGRGQLARERYGREALLVGFTTYSDVVLAR